MKYLIIDDEHELYKNMFSGIFENNKYDIEEVERVHVPFGLKFFYKIHFSDKINRNIFLPFKCVWNKLYGLSRYKFEKEQEYFIIFMNGSLRYHFSIKYLKKLKKKNPNVKYAMIMYDSFSNPAAKRAIKMIPIFDIVLSFDDNDCNKYGLEKIYSTFSYPKGMIKNDKYKSKAFFVGQADTRIDIMKKVFEYITKSVSGCKFIVNGIKKSEEKIIKDVWYNHPLTYKEELLMAYNTDCIFEFVKEGQTGITLRTCEAIAFNKKLITNNLNIVNMPFYDKKYMRVFKTEKDIDISFVEEEKDVNYNKESIEYFSPERIIKIIEKKFEK